ncbi:MAG: trypsin-like peptidase domain-containing protein [Nitrospinae bacterium]|nr:trypsin-like peptidase domain-containing protein [Nitrospinota bacterium]
MPFILKADAKGLLSVKIGDIYKANVGEKVYVISSPGGLENTISDGILSGIREITSERRILQITAPVPEGSSGGPVFNKNGEVIGIATFIVKDAQNLNFTMPINLIKDKISSKNVIALKDAGIIDYKVTAGDWFKFGYLCIETGFYDDAIMAFTFANALDPNYALAHYNRGVAYYLSGNISRAISDFQKACNMGNENGCKVLQMALEKR